MLLLTIGTKKRRGTAGLAREPVPLSGLVRRAQVRLAEQHQVESPGLLAWILRLAWTRCAMRDGAGQVQRDGAGQVQHDTCNDGVWRDSRNRASTDERDGQLPASHFHTPM